MTEVNAEMEKAALDACQKAFAAKLKEIQNQKKATAIATAGAAG
jgi:hypothetical protein